MAEGRIERARGAGRVIRTIYALCLTGATYNHWAIVIRHGLFWDYGGVPAASAAFWTALSFLDPAAVVLLAVRPNAGVAATVAIIVTDVIHNVGILARYHPPLLHALAEASGVIAQIVFMIFVLATARIAWREQAAVTPAAARSSRRGRGRWLRGRRWPG